MLPTTYFRHVVIPMLFLFAFILMGQNHANAFFSDSGTETWVPIDSAQLGGAGGRNQNSLVFNPATNEPYVVKANYASDYEISVMRFNGTTWVTVGNPGFTKVNGDPSIAFNPVTNEPYVSFSDQSEGKVSIYRFNGSTWVPVGNTNFSIDHTTVTTLAFNPVTNEPYVAYINSDGVGEGLCDTPGGDTPTTEEGDTATDAGDTSDPAPGCPGVDSTHNQVVVMKFNGSSWVLVGDGGFDAGSSNPLSLVFDPTTAEPYVAHIDGSSHDILIRKFDGLSWVVVDSFGGGTWADMAFNPLTNEPYVAYLDETCGNKVTVKKYSSSSWVPVGDQCNGSGSPTELDLEFSPTSVYPYVAFIDAHYVAQNTFTPTVMTFTGSVWTTLDSTAPNAEGPYGINMAIKPSTGQPYVMYGATAGGGGSSEDASVVGIMVKTPPSRTGYAPDDNTNNHLDLSGLVVTLFKKAQGTATTTEDVAYENFDAHNIIAGIVRGNTLIMENVYEEPLAAGDTVFLSADGMTTDLQICVWDSAYGCPWGFDSNENLVVITHGWNDDASSKWIQDMGKYISANVDSSETVVQIFDWSTGSRTGEWWQDPQNASEAYRNAYQYAQNLYNRIINMNPKPERIHLIAHSAGSNIIQTVVDGLASYYQEHSNLQKPYIHLTFLDAYAPSFLSDGPKDRYGDLRGFRGYAEQYVNVSIDIFKGDYPDTNEQLTHAVNFDVTSWNNIGRSGHEWPRDFYMNSVKDSIYRIGFPFSTETTAQKATRPLGLEGFMCTIAHLSDQTYVCSIGSLKNIVVSTLPDPYDVTLSPTNVPGEFVATPADGVSEMVINKPGIARVEIPANTKVTSSNPSWDGTISSPQIVELSAPPVSSWFDTGAVSIGFNGGRLLFSDAVKIVLPGRSKSKVSYTHDGVNFAEISETCLSNTQEVANYLPTGGNCKISVGNDMVIWTKHFTTFVTYVEDETAPTTSITLDGEHKNDWYTSDVLVTLTATDTPDGSGVASTTYSLDNGTTWLDYTAPFTLTSEGNHIVLYRSVDKAGNVEDTKVATFFIDLTAPEAQVSADLLTKDLLVTGIDNMGSTTVEKTATGYTITDEAGHTTKLLMTKQWAGKVLTTAQLTGIQYDNAPVVTLPKSSFLYVWTPWKGVANLTSQTVHVNKTYTIGATYIKPFDKTMVLVKENGKQKQKKTYTGLKLVTLTTDKGLVGYEW